MTAFLAAALLHLASADVEAVALRGTDAQVRLLVQVKAGLDDPQVRRGDR